jgi:hypothetical protein
MALPRIATPSYKIELPSTEKEIEIRPFVVKEEKLLVLAMESQDNNEITHAIKNVLQACILTPGVNVETLPTFDIEYLFLMIRGKSVGEEIEVNVIAPDDEITEVPVKISIYDIKVHKQDDHNPEVILDDKLRMRMKYPSLSQFIDNNFIAEDTSNVEKTFGVIASCIDTIYNEEDAWAASDYTDKELTEFIEQLSSTQFKQIEKFFETMPKLSHEVKFKNPKTKKVNKVVLEGLNSFFS